MKNFSYVCYIYEASYHCGLERDLQISSPGVTLSTHFTFVQIHARVDSNVSFQLASLGVLPPTIIAFVRIVASVILYVHLQCTGSDK